MTCPHCGSEQTEAQFCGNCGKSLFGSMTPQGRQTISTHAASEHWRNTKGLGCYGCLTLWMGASFIFGTSEIMHGRGFSHDAGGYLAYLFFPVATFFLGRAFFRRLRRRFHYGNILENPPEQFPNRAPGLSDRQYEKELERFEDVNKQVRVDRLVSGEIETEPIQPLPEEIRAQHVWIPGLPGYGKSTLMHWMIIADLESGKGLTIIDPAGDLIGNGLVDNPAIHIEGIIDWIPPERIDDTIYLDLKTPVPIDFFSYDDEDEKQAVVGNIIDLFTRLAEMFGGQPGVRFGGILRDIIYTLFEAGNTSFLDIYDFIRDMRRREEILKSVSAHTRAQWEKFPNDEKIEPIISRLTPIAKNPRLRTIFGTPNAKLRISDVMNEGKILLVNIGGAPEAGVIMGTMIISQIVQAAFRRSQIPKHRRIPHHLYCDEFQNFTAGTDLARILTQCRKFNLCLTIANQYMGQLPASVLSAVLGGTSTWFLFRVSPEDLSLFKTTLPPMAYTGVWQKRHPDEDLPPWAPDWIKDKDAKPVDTLVDIKPLPFDPQILATLQVGEAIHRKADATAVKVRTFRIGKRPDLSFARYIRERTIELYALPPSAPPPNRVTTEGDAKPDEVKSQKRKAAPREPNQRKAPRSPR